jgi:hypothetical protein
VAATQQQKPQARPAALAPEPDFEDAEIRDLWPRINPAAFYGVAGDIVGLADPHTEADGVAVLVQVLAMFGNMIGRTGHFKVGPTRHFTNLNVAIVGSTATGRKGTAGDVALWALADTDVDWAANCVKGGMSTGEGLIYHVRDPERSGSYEREQIGKR